MVKLKRRYLLVEMLFSDRNGESDPRVKIQDSDFYHAVLAQVASLHGDYGIGAIKSSFQVIEAAQISMCVGHFSFVYQHVWSILIWTISYYLRQVKIYDENTNIAVLRVSSDGLRFLNSALPFVVCISVHSCVLRMAFEGSSMRTVERHLIKMNLASLYSRLRKSTVPADKAAIQKGIVSVTGSRISGVRM